MFQININFSDFWNDFDKYNNFIYNALKTKYDIVISNNPDYIFYSNFGHEYLNYPNAIRIFFTGESIIPDFNLCDFAMGFHFIDFEDRYMRLPLYFLYDQELKKAEVKHLNNKHLLNTKTDFCNFVYSNPDADPNRTDFFEELSKYKFVSSGGAYLNNLGGERVTNKYLFQQKFKFSIAFENSTCNGYTTEKILQAFSAKTIPIYWGNPLINKDFSEGSFINCHSFNSFKDVIEVIKNIDDNDDLFLNYLKTPIYNLQKTFKDYSLELESFLNLIISNGKEFKRNRTFWGSLYEQKIMNCFSNISTESKRKSWINRLK